MQGVAFTGYKGQNAPIKIPVPCAGQTGAKQPEVGDGRPPPPRIRGRFLPESQHCPISRGIPLESGATSCEDKFDANALPPFTDASTSHVLRLENGERGRRDPGSDITESRDRSCQTASPISLENPSQGFKKNKTIRFTTATKDTLVSAAGDALGPRQSFL